MPNSPSILVYGAGAIGGFYGALLHRAGCTVRVVARSEQNIIAQNGLQVQSKLGDLSFHPETVSGSAPRNMQGEAIELPDYLLLCVKVLPEVNRVELVRPWVGPNTCITLIQNGMYVEDELAQAFPENPLLSVLAFVGVTRGAPGQIHHQANGHLVLGSYPSGIDSHARALASLWQAQGIGVQLEAQVQEARWKKSVWNTAFNPLSVLANGADTATMLNSPGGEDLVRAIMHEVCAVAAADGYPTAASTVETYISATKAMPAYKNSMAVDYLAGRPLELQAILGNVVQRARELKVTTPHLDTIWTTLIIREHQ